ncbi:MAG: hypothetical protein ACYTFY_19320 [Planctomycetota bacterium]|jgi:hypothetical protein
MIKKIEYRGKLIHECSIPGETRSEDVFPAHPNGIQLSKNRWLIVCVTRSWRCIDDDRSFVYQLRADKPDGEIITEGIISQSINDWDALDDGNKYVRQHGHPVVFGVPKKARIENKLAENNNVFVAKWRACAKGVYDEETGRVDDNHELRKRTQCVEWCQFRLNDSEDDIEIIKEASRMRENGFEEGERFCYRNIKIMNQGWVQPVPFNAFATEWLDIHHCHEELPGLLPLKYRWNKATGLYEWVETAPVISSQLTLFEGSAARTDNSIVIVGRGQGSTGWVGTIDPFKILPSVVYTTDTECCQPVSLYTCADGKLRLFTGNRPVSPYSHARNPLYAIDIDPLTFKAGDSHQIFDCVKNKVLPNSTIPRAEMAKLLPHPGGNRQTVIWRVRTKNIGEQYGSLEPVTDEMKEAHGIYYAEIVYDKSCSHINETCCGKF